MRILVGDADIQDRLTLQRHLGTFGDCQTVDTPEALARVFREVAANNDERFRLVIIAANLGRFEHLFDEIRAMEWEADVLKEDRCTMVFTGNLVEWMQVSGKLCDSCDSFIAKPLRRELLHTTMANLGFEHVRKKTQHAAFDNVITRFINNEGEILVLADDTSFFSTLRRSVASLETPTDPTYYFSSPEGMKKHISVPVRADANMLLFIARSLGGKLTTEHILHVRELHHRTKVIIFTDETENFNIAYLHDINADNVLTLPASHNNLFEKIANTIHPPAKLQHLLQEARVHLGRKEYRQTLDLLEEALTIKPYSPGVLLLKGDTLKDMGSIEEAVSAYEDAHLSSSLFIDPLKRLADIHKERSPELALAYLEKLDAISPNNPRRKVEIGTAKLETEGIETSQRYYDKGIELAQKESGRLVDELVNVISETLRFRFPKIAIGYINALFNSKRGKFTEQDLETFNRRGVLLRQEGHWKEAIANYRKALTISSGNLILKYNLMMAFMEGRDFASALKYANDIMAVDPEFPRTGVNAAYNLARVYHQQRHPDQARQIVNMALQLDPDHAPSLKLKGKLPPRKAGS